MLQIRRTLLWMILLSLSESVIGGENVTGKVGGDVLLPCSFKDPVPADVFWRFNGSAVFDISDGQPSVPTKQNERFKGRVSSMEEWNKEGNFSIWLKNVNKNHNGTYECTEPDREATLKVRLLISGKSPSKGGALLLQVLLLSAVGLLSS